MGIYNKIEVKVGDIYSFLEIIKETNTINRKRRFDVRCCCGKEFNVALNALRTGNTKSCGCKKRYKHGLSTSHIYKTWGNMKRRCDGKNTKHKYYKNYFLRGIRVCSEWLEKDNGFINFYNWAIDNGYKEELTLDRINNDGNYEPLNCRWATYEQQNTNLRILSTNRSGTTGISWCKTRKIWRAVISINNKTKTISNHKKKNDAIIARNNFIKEHKLPHKLNEVVYG